MQWEIDVGGRVRQVVVQRAGDAFEVTIDDRTWRVDAARIDANSLSLLVDPGARSYDVTVASDAATGLLSVRVGATHVVAAFNGRRTRRESGGQIAAGPLRITAPMPGKVVRVAVNRGDRVQGRQTIIVIEAMKMENELKAARDGVVGELHAREGESVEAGALLAVIQ